LIHFYKRRKMEMVDPSSEYLQGYKNQHSMLDAVIFPSSPPPIPGVVSDLPHSQGPLSKKPRRERTAFTAEQIAVLEEMFKKTGYPDVFQKEEICQRTNLPELKVTIWFKNRRAKDRKSTESGQLDPKTEFKRESKSYLASEGQSNQGQTNVPMNYPTMTDSVAMASTSFTSLAPVTQPDINPSSYAPDSNTAIPTYNGSYQQVVPTQNDDRNQNPGKKEFNTQYPVLANQNQQDMKQLILKGQPPITGEFVPRVTEEFEPILLRLLHEAPEDDVGIPGPRRV